MPNEFYAFPPYWKRYLFVYPLVAGTLAHGTATPQLNLMTNEY